MVLYVLVPVGWKSKGLAPSFRPELCMLCGLLCWDVCDVEDRFVLSKGPLDSTGDSVDVARMGGCFKSGYGVFGGCAIADLSVESGDFVCCVYHLPVNVMKYPVGLAPMDALGKVVVPSELEFERCVKKVR